MDLKIKNSDELRKIVYKRDNTMKNLRNQITQLESKIKDYKLICSDDNISEYRRLVAKCNELSNENYRLKKDMETIRNVASSYPDTIEQNKNHLPI